MEPEPVHVARAVERGLDGRGLERLSPVGRVEVEDEGSGFNHEAVPDPTAGVTKLKTSGRGVYLIKKLMNKVEFSKDGRRIKMVKHLQ